MSKKRNRGKPNPDSRNPPPSPAVEPLPDSTSPHSSKPSISQYVSFGLLLAVIALLGFLFFEVMAKFVVPLFLASILVVVFRPLHAWIMKKSKGREKLSALLTTIAVLVAVLVPLGGLLVVAAAEGRHVIREFNAARLIDGFHQIRTNLKLDMTSADELRTIENDLAELKAHNSFSPEVEYEHSELLFSMEEAAEAIARKQGLTWPPTETTTGEEKGESQLPWDQFTVNLKRARDVHFDLNWEEADSQSDDSQSDDSDTENRDKWHEYQVLLNQTSQQFSLFKTDLLGGKTRTWLKELANPSASETESYIESAVEYSRTKLLKLGGAGASYIISCLVGTAIMIIGLYFFLLDGPKMIEAFKGLSPIDDDHEQELVDEFSSVSRAVVVATLLSALVQGLLAGIGFYFTGLDSIFLLTVLSAVLAMVPFVGAASVWVPCCLYLYFVQDDVVGAVGLAIYGAAIISMADNVIKPLILHGQSNLHPLLALLSVLGGVAALGPIGILVGPMVVAFLQTLLNILKREMSEFDQLSQPPSPS